jgi:putative endonuclease
MSFSVYILSCADKTLYTGYAKDVASRVALHNGEKKGGARYTSSRRPVRLVYTEECASKVAAMQREYAIKQLPRVEKQRLIRSAKRAKNSV